MKYHENTFNRSIFTQILSGEVVGVILLTTERFFVILTNKPARPGHTLIIPRRCGVQYSQFSREELSEFGLVKQLVIRALEEAYKIDDTLKIGEHVSGFEIRNHYHMHLIPAEKGEQVSLQGTREVSLDERMSEGSKIIPILKRISGEYPELQCSFK
ncbi:MAG: HIT family protein [Candidatus Gracilibacteria bacterium]|nr:HIT family protein [Candidatus Gracilibacteria bacterium]